MKKLLLLVVLCCGCAESDRYQVYPIVVYKECSNSTLILRTKTARNYNSYFPLMKGDRYFHVGMWFEVTKIGEGDEGYTYIELKVVEDK